MNQTPHDIRRLSDSNLTLASPAEDVRGRKVLNTVGEDIGEVDDLMIDGAERKVRFIRVASGGFPRHGRNQVPHPVDAITQIGDDAVRVDRTREGRAVARL